MSVLWHKVCHSQDGTAYNNTYEYTTSVNDTNVRYGPKGAVEAVLDYVDSQKRQKEEIERIEKEKAAENARVQKEKKDEFRRKHGKKVWSGIIGFLFTFIVLTKFSYFNLIALIFGATAVAFAIYFAITALQQKKWKIAVLLFAGIVVVTGGVAVSRIILDAIENKRTEEIAAAENLVVDVNVPLSASECIGLSRYEVEEMFEAVGFREFDYEYASDLLSAEEELEDTIISVTIEGNSDFNVGEVYQSDSIVLFRFHSMNKIYAPFDSEELYGMNYEDVVYQLEEAGFTNIQTEKVEDLIIGWLTEDGDVEEVSIDGRTEFESYNSFVVDVPVIVRYHTFPEVDNDDEEFVENEESEGELANEFYEETDSVFYSTNDRATAKLGNTGVYAYRENGQLYDIYWIVDFDEGYVYYFTDGNGENFCDRLEIESGTLNDAITITYHDGGDTWSYKLYFKYAEHPETLIMADQNGFKYEYSAIDLDDALAIRETKRITDY